MKNGQAGVYQGETAMADFQDIIGQEQIKEHMRNALKANKISHAYIINGEKYAGKEFVAKVFAMALQCEERAKGNLDMVPCQQCHSCKQALSDNQPDIIKVTHEKTPNSIGVDDVREQISGSVVIKPYSSPHKIYIVPEAEKMTQQAQNALLKTLEEPPEYAVIMLLTSNINALLPTILSRCVVLNMKPVSDMLVRKFLMEEMKVTDYKADVCVAFARGNLGKAKSLASSEEFDNVKSEALSMLKYIQDMEISEMVAGIKHISEYKLNVPDYLDIILIWYRDALLFKATSDINRLVFREESSTLRKVASRCSYEGIERVIEALEKAKRRLDANVNVDLTLELLFMAIKENG